MIEEQAYAAIQTVSVQEEEVMARYAAWGQNANDEINSLLNSFHQAALRDENSEEQLAMMEAQLRP